MKYKWKVSWASKWGKIFLWDCLSILNAFMQTGSLRLHRKHLVMVFLFGWRGSLCDSRPSLISCRFYPDTHAYAHSISLSHFETHSLWHILISLSLSLTNALLDCDVSSSLGLPAVLAHLEVRHTVGRRNRSNRTTRWLRSVNPSSKTWNGASGFEDLTEDLNLSTREVDKVQRYTDSQNGEELNQENYTILMVTLRNELDFSSPLHYH